MAEIGLAAAQNRATPIPNAFIDHYMPFANPGFVTVYLYAYKKWYWGGDQAGGDEVVLQSAIAAKDLDMMESDVLRAFKHWQKKGILRVQQSDEKMTVTFLPVEKPQEKKTALPEADIPPETEVPAETKAAPAEQEADSIAENAVPALKAAVKKATPVIAKRPHYEVKEIDLYIKNSESVRLLFESAAQHLGKVLSYNDMSLIFSFHDWLRLPIDVIDTLLQFCTNNNNWSMRYIEKVAIDWADRGISSVESAKEHIRLYNTDFRDILKAMGIKNRDPVESEEAFMCKWLKVMKMPLELIQNACGKTIMQVGKPNFPYTDQILTNWYQTKANTLEDVRKLEEEHIKTRISSEKDKPAKGREKKQAQNRFVNYEQRTDWDFEALEKMDQEYLDNDLK